MGDTCGKDSGQGFNSWFRGKSILSGIEEYDTSIRYLTISPSVKESYAPQARRQTDSIRDQEDQDTFRRFAVHHASHPFRDTRKNLEGTSYRKRKKSRHVPRVHLPFKKELAIVSNGPDEPTYLLY